MTLYSVTDHPEHEAQLAACEPAILPPKSWCLCEGTGRIRCTARGCGEGCWNCHGQGSTPCNYVGCDARC